MHDDLNEEELTDSDAADIVDELTDDDLRERSQELDEAQTAWEEMMALQPQIPCPECTGAGSIAAGSLGDICPRCLGKRTVLHPGHEPPEAPPFATLRGSITAYGNALAARALPDTAPCEMCGAAGKVMIANQRKDCPKCDGTGRTARTTPRPELPPASSVPSMDELQSIKTRASEIAKQLPNRPLEPGAKLPEYEPPKGLAGDGNLGDFTDAELAEMEDADLGEDES